MKSKKWERCRDFGKRWTVECYHEKDRPTVAVTDAVSATTVTAAKPKAAPLSAARCGSLRRSLNGSKNITAAKAYAPALRPRLGLIPLARNTAKSIWRDGSPREKLLAAR